MLYRKDAHQSTKSVRQKQSRQFAKGVVMLALSLGLMFYAVPCFATSVWDDNGAGTPANSTSFSSAISDNEYSAAAAESTVQGADPAAAVADDAASESLSGLPVSDTVGPGLLTNEDAVKSAKLRAQAVSVAKAERNSRILATQYPDSASLPTTSPDLTFAYIALVMSFVTGVFGVYTVIKARSMRGRVIAAAYDSALRAL